MAMTAWKQAMVAAVAMGFVTIGAPAYGDGYTPDAWITTKAKMALYTADAVSGTAVNVDTIDGRVTLHGTVSSEQEKANATQAIKGIDGVKEVRNLLAVVPPQQQDVVEVADEQIQERVEAAFARDTRLEDTDIEVSSVNDGTVLLSGTAKTMSEQLYALSVTRAVPGVQKVASQIQGPDRLTDIEIWRMDDDAAKQAGDSPDKGTVKGAMSDAWITSAAKVRLIANADTPALDINVDTRDGAVTLFGMVPDEAAKRAAEAEVKQVAGVRSINNQLRVVPEAKQDRVEAKDEEIQERVVKRLDAAPLDDDDIDVAVNAGVVRLSGEVDTQSERLRALTVARGTPGVRSVIDQLAVERQAAAR